MKGFTRWMSLLGLLVLLFAVMPASTFAATKPKSQPHTVHHYTVTGRPYVVGNRIYDGSGNPIIFRGTHISSALDVAHPESNEVLATQHLNSQFFTVLHDTWNMNAVRIATSDWLWDADKLGYIAKLQQVANEANQAGLYVIFSLHEDDKTGLPFPPNNVNMPSPKAVEYWTAVASTFKDNPMVIFDVFNEPREAGLNRYKLTDADWQYWLHGGTRNGRTVVGMQDLVNAIRSTGAQQIVIVEAFENWFATIGNNFVQDQEVVYSVHQYFQPSIRTISTWDQKFGKLSLTKPMYIGEWALQPNPAFPSRCIDLAYDQTTQLLQSFLTYMEQHYVSWTAYAFLIKSLITDYTNYTPSTLNRPWTCGDLTSTAGDGELVKNYLTTHSSTAPHH